MEPEPSSYEVLFDAMGLADLNTLFSSTGLVIVGLAAIGVGIALAVRFLKKGKSAA
jgi:hypothetical protein